MKICLYAPIPVSPVRIRVSIRNSAYVPSEMRWETSYTFFSLYATLQKSDTPLCSDGRKKNICVRPMNKSFSGKKKSNSYLRKGTSAHGEVISSTEL